MYSIRLFSQDCSITSKANDIAPDRLCSPVNATWHVDYNGVNNNGTLVQIRFNWNDGTEEIVDATNVAGSEWDAVANHTYGSDGNICNYRPRATLIVNGQECTSSTQEQIVTVWDNDDHNGGHMHIDPEVYPICFGDSADVRFTDNTRFNCVPPQENDVPNVRTRWVQWIYGTDNTMTGKRVTINGDSVSFPDTASIIVLPGPVTGSGVISETINVSSDKQVGEYFQVTLRNWNWCNPYDDPNIPGPPVDSINGDHEPMVTTAIILIVPLPDATIITTDTLCLTDDPIRLESVNPGGIWTGDGVVGNRFYPAIADTGNHIIRYSITDGSGCSDWDETMIRVEPSPDVSITPVGTVYVDDPPIVLHATDTGGIWTGSGVQDSTFYPSVAGLGEHIIMYETLPDHNGCSGYDTIHIRVIMPPAPVADFSSDTSGCSPLTVQFVNSSLYGKNYLWDFGDNTYSNEENPLHVFYLPGHYVVTLSAMSISGKSTHREEIKVYQNPVVLFEVYPTEIINNNQIIKTINNTLYADYYLWCFGDNSTSDEFEPWHKYMEEGTYTVSLVASTVHGCVDSLAYSTSISVSFNQGFIKFPNAFRWNQVGPNGGYWQEGKIDNTIFHPIFYNVSEYHLMIFDRWGELIYTSDDIHKGWDGYLDDGTLAIQGVYVWKVKGVYVNGQPFIKVGDVTFLH